MEQTVSHLTITEFLSGDIFRIASDSIWLENTLTMAARGSGDHDRVGLCPT
jgi:hypothetical protein